MGNHGAAPWRSVPDPSSSRIEQRLARSGDRIALAAYLGDDNEFDQALAAVASAYADTNEADHARLREAVEDGRLTSVATA